MKATRRGSTQIVKGRVYGLFWLGGEGRESVPMPGVSAADALAVASRRDVIADTANRLVDAGHADRAMDFAVQLGAATTPRKVEAITKEAARLVETARVTGGGLTVRQFGDRWTNGTLARTYPDYVKIKKRPRDDREIFARYVYPVVGPVVLKRFGLDDGERVMARLPAGLSPARRRHVAQALHRLLAMAVYPAKILAAHPLPKGFLPKLGQGRAKQWLYPDEDRKLLACTVVPLVDRLFYGLIAREGFRFEEALLLEWSDLDLEHGAVRLDVNKTSDPRAWALDPGVTRALSRWKEMRPKLVKPFTEVPDGHQAERLRHDLKLAKVTRSSLFRSTTASIRLRFHDLRATFVTVSLANGKSETWVSDRTGHKSSQMIAKYRRAARTHAELNLGPLDSLDAALVWEQATDCQTRVKRYRKSGETSSP